MSVKVWMRRFHTLAAAHIFFSILRGILCVYFVLSSPQNREGQGERQRWVKYRWADWGNDFYIELSLVQIDWCSACLLVQFSFLYKSGAFILTWLIVFYLLCNCVQVYTIQHLPVMFNMMWPVWFYREMLCIKYVREVWLYCFTVELSIPIATLPTSMDLPVHFVKSCQSLSAMLMLRLTLHQSRSAEPVALACSLSAVAAVLDADACVIDSLHLTSAMSEQWSIQQISPLSLLQPWVCVYLVYFVEGFELRC